MAAYYGWQFHTKLELAAAQIEWLVQQLGPDHPPIWVVTDGAYVKRPFLKRVLGAGVTVISRLRCDAALWSLPPVVDPGQKKGRGRPPKYGKGRIDLARRTAKTRGWQTGLFSLYGRLVVKKYKTFLATYKPVGGVIRVVLVREPDRWVAYFSTDPDLSVASILETVADRSALEQVFHDVKEVHGAGQQQLRHVWANVGAWNLIGWWHTLVELWAWDRPQSRLRDRSDSPWDKPERRPSHANRCQELRREALQEEYSSLPSVGGLRRKIRRFIQRHAQSRMRLTVLGKCRNWGVDRTPANLLLRSDLTFLIRTKLEMVLDETVSTDDGWKFVAFNLINSLNREERTIELIRVIREARPKDTTLIAFCDPLLAQADGEAQPASAVALRKAVAAFNDGFQEDNQFSSTWTPIRSFTMSSTTFRDAT